MNYETETTGRLNEEWRPIPGYDNYEVSNYGKLKNIKKTRPVMGYSIKTKSNPSKKRLRYALYRNGKKRTINAARLVAVVFLDLCIDDLTKVADHRNNNSEDDYIGNIQIISHRENTTKDRTNKNSFTGVSKKGNKFRSQIRINGIKTYLGLYDTPEEANHAYLEAKLEIISKEN